MKLASLLVLVAGLTIAAGIYFFAPEPDEDMAMYEVTISKQYNRTLRQFGGKASVLFDDFQSWFAARWRGKSLGVTIGCITVVVSLALYLVASRR
jgi:hypothetical protein